MSIQKYTNEELAGRIRNGERDLMVQLWDQVYAFIYGQAIRFWHHFRTEYGCARFDVEDLVQSGYFALEAAVRYCDPEKGGFLKALGMTLKTAFAEVAGVRSSKRDAILFADSGDQPISEGGDVTLFDTVEDSRQTLDELLDEPEREARQKELGAVLENCLDRLSDDLSCILRRHYYDGISQNDIAAVLGCSRECVRLKRKKALDQIRDERFENGLNAFLEANTNYYQKASLSRFKTTGESIVETIVFDREKKAQQWIKNYFAKKKKGGFHGKTTDVGRNE